MASWLRVVASAVPIAQKMCESTKGFFDLSDINVATLLTTPHGLAALSAVALVTGGVAIYEAIEAYRLTGSVEKIDKKLEKLVEHHFAPLRAAAKALVLENLDVFPDELSKTGYPDFAPALVKLLTHRFDDEAERAQRLTALFEKHSDVCHRFAAALLREGELLNSHVNDLQDDMTRLAASFSDTVANLSLRPPLLTRLVSKPTVVENRRLVYTSRYVPLIGRGEELARLREFLGPIADFKDPFRWTLLTGEGGAGKSRLALEFVLEAHAIGWDAGFLSDSASAVWNDWYQWRPSRPTLVVVDYVARYPEEVRTAILQVAGRCLEYPVRFLLLERPIGNAQTPPKWLEELIGTDGLIEQLQYPCDSPIKELSPLPIPMLADLAILHLARHQPDRLARISPQVVHSEVVNLFKRFANVRHHRPLFAIAAGEAIAEKGAGHVTTWTTQELLKATLNREYLLWEKALGRLDAKHLNLLFLACLHRGVSASTVYALAADPIFRPLLPSRREFDQAMYSVLTGRPHSRDDATFAPLEPDLLGELLILQSLNGDGPRGHPNSLSLRDDSLALLNAAWDANESATARVAIDLVRDLAGLPAIRLLLQAPPEHLVYWSYVAISSIEFLIMAEEDDLARDLVDDVDKYSPRVEARKGVLLFRGTAYSKRNGEGDQDRAIADYTRLIESQTPNGPANEMHLAQFQRAESFRTRKHDGDIQQALDDYATLINSQSTSDDEKALALNSRAQTYRERNAPGDWQAAVDDCTSVINMPVASINALATALYQRGDQYRLKGGSPYFDLAREDLYRVIGLSRVPEHFKASAWFCLGALYAGAGASGFSTAKDCLLKALNMPEMLKESRDIAQELLQLLHTTEPAGT